MVDIQFLGLLNATLQAATLLFIASLGELITEKSGILNLGVEGMISIGAVTGFMTAVNTNNIFHCTLNIRYLIKYSNLRYYFDFFIYDYFIFIYLSSIC